MGIWIGYLYRRDPERPAEKTGKEKGSGKQHLTLDPLPGRGGEDRNQGNRMAAEAEVRRQQQLLAATEAEVRADYESALLEYQLRQAEFTNALQPLREHAAAISTIAAAAYSEGGTDLLRLLDAERARLDAELAWARGMADYRQSMARLEAAEGVN